MYPVTFEADYLRERNRTTTFFRMIVAIPWLIVGVAYAIALSVLVLIGLVAVIILGRYPQGIYDLVGGFLRYQVRVSAFTNLLTDDWPPFGLADDPSYPVRLHIAEPAARQSRLKALFRVILVIPILFVRYAVGFMQAGASIVAWLTIVFRGYQPAAIHNVLAWITGWGARTDAYAYVMRDEYPPVGDETPVEVDPPAGAAALDSGEVDVSLRQGDAPGTSAGPDSTV